MFQNYHNAVKLVALVVAGLLLTAAGARANLGTIDNDQLNAGYTDYHGYLTVDSSVPAVVNNVSGYTVHVTMRLVSTAIYGPYYDVPAVAWEGISGPQNAFMSARHSADGDDVTKTGTFFTPASTVIVYLIVNDVEKHITVNLAQTQHKVRLNIPGNTGDFDTQYDLLQDGSVVGTVTKRAAHDGVAGDGPTVEEITVPSTSDVRIAISGVGYAQEGVSVNVVPGAVTKVAEAGPAKAATDPDSPQEFNIPNVDMPKKAGAGGGAAGAGAWDKTTDTKPNDNLTNATYKQGVDSTVKKLEEMRAAQQDRYDKSADRRAVQGKLDDIIKGNTDSSIESTSQSVIAAAQQRMIADTQTQMNALGIPSVTTHDYGSITAGSGGWPSFLIPGIGTVDLDPFSKFSNLRDLLNIVREAVLWFIVAWWIKEAVDEINQYVRALMITPQVTSSNSVDTQVPIWAHIKQMVNAIGIMIVMVGAYGAFVLLMNTHLATIFTGGVTAFGSHPGPLAAVNSIGGPILDLFSAVFPIKAAVELLVAEIALRMGMAPLFISASRAASVIRA